MKPPHVGTALPVLSSQPRGRSVCATSLPGLCLAGGLVSLLHWPGGGDQRPDTKAALAQSHRHGWYLGMCVHCSDALMCWKVSAQTSSNPGHMRYWYSVAALQLLKRDNDLQVSPLADQTTCIMRWIRMWPRQR